jgi:lysophospholipase L1-like esterase
LGWMPNWISQAIRQHKGRVHCIWGAPINDFYDGTVTDQFVYDNGVVPLIKAIRSIDPAAAITICTGTKSTTPSVEAHFEASSTLIRNGAAANNYSVVELRNDPIMGTYNSTIYKDAVHPTNAGHDRMATLIQPRIQSWLTSIGVS